MSLKDSIVAYAISQGADLVGVAQPRAYRDYLEQVRARLQETQATGKDFMLYADAMTFFTECLKIPGLYQPNNSRC